MKNRDAWFELLVYLVSSAERIKGEPAVYAPLRLIEAAQRLCHIMLEEPSDLSELDQHSSSQREAMRELEAIIEKGKHKNMTDQAAFYQMLEEASEKLIDCM